MDSDTAMRLGRKAIAYYSLGKAEQKADPAAVALAAVDAALNRIPFAAPWTTRWKIALNALAPSVLSRRIFRRWKRT